MIIEPAFKYNVLIMKMFGGVVFFFFISEKIRTFPMSELEVPFFFFFFFLTKFNCPQDASCFSFETIRNKPLSNETKKCRYRGVYTGTFRPV